MNQASPSAFIGSVADLLRGGCTPSGNGSMTLPFTVLRRLDIDEHGAAPDEAAIA